jgi:hypothetical protein
VTQSANHGFVVDTLQYLIKSGSRAGEGEKKESARGSVHWGCDYATALDIEVDPQRHRFGRREPDFALQKVLECRASKPERVRDVLLRRHSSGSQVRRHSSGSQ